MPRHTVRDDLAAGRLVELRAVRWDGREGMPRLPVMAVRRKAATLGPAGAWLLARLWAGVEEEPAAVPTLRLASGRSGG